MTTTEQELGQGLKLHQAGNLRGAEAVYRQVLAREPHNADALHLLGVVALQSGQHQAAWEQVSRAIALNPNQALYHNHLGIALTGLNRAEEAAAEFRRTIELAPNMPDAHYNLGNVQRDQGDLPAAIASFRRAVQLRPRYIEAQFNLGNVLRSAGQLREAAKCFQQALLVKPDYVKALLNLGIVWEDLEELDQAAETFRQVLRLQPNSAKAHNNLATVLRAQKQPEASLVHFHRAIELEPDFSEAYNNLATSLTDLKRFDEALIEARRALELNPSYAKAHNAVGAALRGLEQLEAAANSFQRAVDLSADLNEARSNLGSVRQEQGRHDEALAWYEEALRIKPQCADTHFACATVWLLRGNYERGWPEYEWRLKAKDRPPRSVPGPLWDGGPLAGRSILLHAEQGMGDTLQFIRYAAVVKESGGVVTVGCPAGLAPLLSSCQGIDQLSAEISLERRFDVQAPLMSLAGILHSTDATIPNRTPYLSVSDDLIAQWKVRLADYSGLRIAINWQGNPKYPGDRQRSIPLAMFAPLAALPEVTLLSVQKGFGSEQIASVSEKFSVVDLGPQLDLAEAAFLDTAAVMMNVDLVVTSDTSIAHLAGALGVRVWMPTQFSPDWRWQLEREDSPWYPTMRLFRQPQRGDWPAVFERLAAELRAG